MVKRRNKTKPKGTKLPNGLLIEKRENPNWNPAYGPSGNPRRVEMVINPRESPLSNMYYNNKSMPRYQYEAGLYFRHLYERKQLGGGLKAMNPTKEPVDGNPPCHDPISDPQTRAFNELKRVEDYFSKYDYKLIEAFLGEGKTLGELRSTGHGKRKASAQIRACLEILAIQWGFRSKPRRYEMKRTT